MLYNFFDCKNNSKRFGRFLSNEDKPEIWKRTFRTLIKIHNTVQVQKLCKFKSADKFFSMHICIINTRCKRQILEMTKTISKNNFPQRIAFHYLVFVYQHNDQKNKIENQIFAFLSSLFYDNYKYKQWQLYHKLFTKQIITHKIIFLDN
jgi:hypothetical protein